MLEKIVRPISTEAIDVLQTCFTSLNPLSVPPIPDTVFLYFRLPHDLLESEKQRSSLLRANAYSNYGVCSNLDGYHFENYHGFQYHEKSDRWNG